MQMNRFLVISCNAKAKPLRIHMDAAYEASSDESLLRIAGFRRTSDVLLALTPKQLRQFADELESRTPEQIAETQQAAKAEEDENAQGAKVEAVRKNGDAVKALLGKRVAQP
jgi:hypothetical protein